MTFDELLAQVVELLQRQGRVSYGALKRRFALDDAYLQDLKDELIDAQRVASDEDGKVLVWVGASPVSSSTFQVSSSQPPAPSTHLPDAPRSTLHAPRAEAERRQLTVLFCDLVDSTKLSEQLDPEDYREVVRNYQATGTEVILRYEGHIAQHLGDGILVYFSYPVAHEDDAQRAVRTGLEILAGLQALNAQLQPSIKERLPHPIQVRIGIHTGLVVIGEIGSSEKREILAMGETPNLAARLQGLAEPDTLVVSAATQRLVTGLFECQELGPQTLKGISTPLSVYRVVRESEAQSRFEVAVSAGLTPLIGREHEVGLLAERWERAKQGEGQAVLLSGEPGIGKSRLVQTLKEQVVSEGATRIEFRCSPYHQNSAFYPVIEYLQRVLQFDRDDSPEQKLDKLEQALSHSRLDLKEAVPLFASLLSLPASRYTLPVFSPQKQKQKTQEAVVAWLVEEAECAPVCCPWEDVHWADPSSLELLTLLIDQVATARLYLLLTFRPEFTPPWGTRSHISQLTLSRLGRSQVRQMIEQVRGGKTLPAEVVQQIIAKTDGVPLFVEELTKMVVESGLYAGAQHAAPLSLAIPTTLQDSLAARLDRLATAKEVAQLGATLGREFAYELIRGVSPLEESLLQQELTKLVEAELLYQRGLPPQATYIFKHALVQDTAYQSLLKSKRQQYHQQIAQVLEEKFLETKETQPELLAHHYTEAGLTTQAILYWQRAGERATQRSAYVEAISHLTRGLEVLKALPDTPERTHQELTLQIVLRDALVVVKGYIAPEVEKTVLRARELCQQIGENPQLFPVLWRLWAFYINRGEFQTTRELAEQMMRLAQSVQDRYLLSAAHLALGCTLYWLGELTSARTLLEQAIALYDPQKHPRPTVNTADPRVDCLSYAAWALWTLGYPDQALQRSQGAVALAEGLSHPFSLAYALGIAAWFHSVRREEQLARERAEAVITLSTEQGFPYWLAFGTMVRGWALAEQGQVEEGIAQMRQLSRNPFVIALLAEAYGKVGQVEEGLTVLAKALAVVDKTGVHVNEAELYRLKGELTLQKETRGWRLETSPPSSQASSLKPQVSSEAEACFQKAIEIARKQQAKSLELRAVMSLVRLRQQQAMQYVSRTTQHEARALLDAARNMLSEIYNWFTEGFDTKDLQEAKALLDELP